MCGLLLAPAAGAAGCATAVPISVRAESTERAQPELLLRNDGPATVAVGLRGPSPRTIALAPGAHQVVALTPGTYRFRVRYSSERAEDGRLRVEHGMRYEWNVATPKRPRPE